MQIDLLLDGDQVGIVHLWPGKHDIEDFQDVVDGEACDRQLSDAIVGIGGLDRQIVRLKKMERKSEK